jgi:hypothetical protein
MSRTVALAVCTLFATTAVRAQPATGEAEALFDEGIRLSDAGNYAEACAAFDASQRLESALNTLLNQADCREKNNQLATAWSLFLEAERQARSATDAPTRELHELAVQRSASLQPKLSMLTISVPAASRVPGLVITRDGDPVDAGAWGRALPVDGGTHTVVARAPDFAEWSGTINVAVQKDNQSIEVPALHAAPAQVVAKPAAPIDTRHVEQPTSKVVPIVLGSAAVILGATAIGFELSAESTYDASKREPDDTKQNSLYDSANHKRYTAEGLGVAGLGCLGVAAWWYFTHRHATDSGPTITPVPTPNAVGLQLGLSF